MKIEQSSKTESLKVLLKSFPGPVSFYLFFKIRFFLRIMFDRSSLSSLLSTRLIFSGTGTLRRVRLEKAGRTLRAA